MSPKSVRTLCSESGTRNKPVPGILGTNVRYQKFAMMDKSAEMEKRGGFVLFWGVRYVGEGREV